MNRRDLLGSGIGGIAGLRQLIRDEVAHQLGDEQTSRTGQTVTPGGAVSYDFEGHISAEGIDLPAGTSDTPPDDSRVRWLRQSDGSVVADVFGYEMAGAVGLWDRVEADDAGELARRILQAFNTPAGHEARLEVRGGVNAGSTMLQGVADGETATLWAAGRVSEFLQLASGAAKQRIAIGRSSTTWPGGSTASNVSAAIAHNLNNANARILIQTEVTGLIFPFPLVNTRAADTFTVRLVNPLGAVAAGNPTSFDWIAIG